MVVREPEQRPRSVPLTLIDRLVIAGAVQVDSNLLTHLAERQAALLVIPARGYRRSSHLFGTGHGDAERRLGQYRMVLDRAAAPGWARRFVVLKLAGQLRLLRRIRERRSGLRRPLSQGIEALQNSLREVRLTLGLERLRGLEGAATARFFAAYRVAFAPSLGFQRRNRRPPRDPVNAALSLGYTLVHGDALQAAVRAGLDPLLGFLHETAHNRESLACDLVEIARPRVERLVWRLFAEQTLRSSQFNDDNGAVRLGKAARGRFFAAYEGHAAMHRRWFRRYALQIARAAAGAHGQPATPLEGWEP